jgi:CRISPR/Cas system-associated exonuclease Cas4 (RecB family)
LIELEGDVNPLKRLSLQDMSYSRINTYEWCELKYYYAYILKVPQTYGAAAVLGNMIHKALEITLEDGEPINKLELLQNYKAAVSEYDPTGDIVSEGMVQEGENMLVAFIQDNPGPVNVHEKEMAFSFVLGRARINGFIDFVSVDETQVHIKDYKSGKRQITKKETPTNIQLGIYSLFMNYLFPDKKVYAELYYMRKGSTRGHTFTKEELEEVEVNITNKIEEILNKENFLPTADENKCRYCSFAEDGTCSAGAKRLLKSPKW